MSLLRKKACQSNASIKLRDEKTYMNRPISPIMSKLRATWEGFAFDVG
jgi:hypothetical protein